MPLNVPDVGENKALEAIVNKTAPETLIARLFINNITPSDTDTTATFTQAGFGGYAQQSLTPATWGTAAAGLITYGAQLAFTCNAVATDDVYGYYIVQTTSNVLMWAERDPSAPFAVRNSGDEVRFTPVLSAN